MKIKNKNIVFFLRFVTLFAIFSIFNRFIFNFRSILRRRINFGTSMAKYSEQILSNSLAKVRLLVWHRASKGRKQDIDTETGNRRPLGILSCCRSDTNGCFHLSVCILPLLFFQESFYDIVTYPEKKTFVCSSNNNYYRGLLRLVRLSKIFIDDIRNVPRLIHE